MKSTKVIALEIDMPKGKREANMEIWSVLGKTDPAHTKQFTRAGGFKGTAIKPMWANLRMTEFFGPCGIGWGQTEPQFQTINTEAEILVYCTVGLWFVQGDRSQTVYGVGGDKVLTQVFVKDAQGNKVKDEAGRFRTYPQTDDEAFKKAYTDALSNAMKFIGVGADVHMGQFDDNKYVREVAAEFDEAKKAEVNAEIDRQKAGPTLDVPPELDWSYNKASGVLICRFVEAKEVTNKKGKSFVVVKLNQKIDNRDEVFYFHDSFRAELLAATGKVCKLMLVTSKQGHLNIDLVLEIDGKIMAKDEPPATSSSETEARLLASTLDYSEEQLRELYSTYASGSWNMTLEYLKDHKVAREAPAE